MFGGAIVCSLPNGFADVSTIRPVPDNQEVYANVDTDASFVIEILEREPVDDKEAAQHLLSDLLEFQDAVLEDGSVLKLGIEVPAAQVSHDGTSVFIDGICAKAAISKYKEPARNRVLVLAAVVRLPSVQTDILVSHNVPLYIAPNSSSAASSTATPAAVAAAPSLDAGADEASRVAAATATFGRVLSTFCVKDWGLFGGEESMEEA